MRTKRAEICVLLLFAGLTSCSDRVQPHSDAAPRHDGDSATVPLDVLVRGDGSIFDEPSPDVAADDAATTDDVDSFETSLSDAADETHRNETWLRARVEGVSDETTREFAVAPLNADESGWGTEWFGERGGGPPEFVTCRPYRAGFVYREGRRFVFEGTPVPDRRALPEISETEVRFEHFPLPDVLAALGLDAARVLYFGGRCTLRVHDVTATQSHASITLVAPCTLTHTRVGMVPVTLRLTHFEYRAEIRHATMSHILPIPPINCPFDDLDAGVRDD